jgi:bacterioferritin (cytochrome b1)
MTLNDFNRRQMLVRAAAAAAGLGLAASINAAARRASAKVEPAPNATTDNTILNQLLTAEYDAIATYTAGAGIIAGDMVTDATTKDTVTKVAVHFQDQHKQHAAALAQLITANGGTPVVNSGVAKIPTSFPTAATTTDVMKLAADKEKHAAVAYVNVMKSISTPAAAKLVAAIGGVETQHFVVLNLLISGLISANATTNTMAALVVPAAFVLNVGATGTTNLETFPALDTLLTLDAA